MYTRCAQCGIPLPGGRRADARFCTSGGPNSCKDAYHNAHKARDVETVYTSIVPSADGKTDVEKTSREHGPLPIGALAGDSEDPDSGLDPYARIVTSGENVATYVTEEGTRLPPLVAVGVQSSVKTRANEEFLRKSTATTMLFRPNQRTIKYRLHSEAQRIRSLVAEGMTGVAIALCPREMAAIRRDDNTLANALLKGRLNQALSVIAQQALTAADSPREEQAK